jgi:hypothetical protein
MSCRVALLIAVAAIALAGCSVIGAIDAKQASQKASECIQTVRNSPEGQIVFARIWLGDGTDTAAKLSDPLPLTKEQQEAFVQVHNKMMPCRQIIIQHDNSFAAWETPYWQELFQRGDQIFYKLASGELPVGVANKLIIESTGSFQVDVSRGHANAVRVEEAQRQRAAEAMLLASAQVAASQPRVTTTNCSWVGNTLNCTSLR